VPLKPLAIVSGLTIGDYALWNWSLNGSHDVLALVSGLTLPPLAAACLWLLALTAARALARTSRRSAAPATRKVRSARANANAHANAQPSRRRRRSSGKIAA
jgi:hypothetical protein